MSNDGVALTFTSHPRDERLIEAVCRAICRAEGVDPDAEGYGLGVCMPVGAKYRLWEARRRQADAAIEALLDVYWASMSDLRRMYRKEAFEEAAKVARDAANDFMRLRRDETEIWRDGGMAYTMIEAIKEVKP